MKKILILLMCLVLGLSLMGCSSGVSGKEAISFSNLTLEKDITGTSILGEVTNNGNKTYSFFGTITFYDTNKKIIDTGNIAVNKLEPGETRTFESMVLEKDVTKSEYKIQIDTID